MQWMDLLVLRGRMKLKEWKKNEDGMEIIQVLILLALGVALIAVFIGFKDSIMVTVNKLVNDFLKSFK